MLIKLRGPWPFIWFIISQYLMIITSQKQNNTVGIILCRHIGKNMRSLRHHQLCEENEVCVPVYSVLPVGIMFRGPVPNAKHWFVELWVG